MSLHSCEGCASGVATIHPVCTGRSETGADLFLHRKRPVAPYFEELLPIEGNEDYYRETRMPMSFATIRAKLEAHGFQNLTELESDCKRMIQNAKDYYHKDSLVFNDAERVRKAISNFMVRTNPAYQDPGGYVATATPLPPNPTPLQLDIMSRRPYGHTAPDPGGPPVMTQDADGDDVGAPQLSGRFEANNHSQPTSAETPAKPVIVFKRRGPGRPPKEPEPEPEAEQDALGVDDANEDTKYQNIEYQGLSFQQGQEKIVEELIRAEDDE